MTDKPVSSPTASDADTTVETLRREIAAFVHERDWEQFHDPKNLSIAIATEAAELMEHFRWVRNEHAADLLKDEKALAGVRDEVADTLAFLLSFANASNIDLTQALRDKMRRNAKKYPVEVYKGKY
ncbi:MAG TPA: nucleotide pyrophosphohydrolase [Phycisphaerae bacterium]|nr:nucleotide pyrophosphohydrolase [Phycisphaerae bacterium]HOJ56434.1 nucleotide pyrophosphohydrolase [Phycisphaerae bacterium]HOL28005.1 nucleotide pyrophosphohydrolase [Phycisphaerae bacterium]HPP22408.1 nucleotide pyrophosphohydrolase [Phycisphaerae bacterium]HPU34245.1 nucleotide pyrophosphohydrolase [Phycisphaerae bacterium]